MGLGEFVVTPKAVLTSYCHSLLLTSQKLPLHSSGITACTYHLFYNRIPILVPFQAFLTCVGNTTAAYAALRIALSNGWTPPIEQLRAITQGKATDVTPTLGLPKEESRSLVGFEDLGDALAGDNDYSFLLKLFGGCAAASYMYVLNLSRCIKSCGRASYSVMSNRIKYGETFFDFPFDANVWLGLSVVLVPSSLNAFKWWKRSQDPSFEGWF